MAKPKKYVIIEWEDISGEPDGWLEVKRANATELAIVWSVGWLYREDEHHYYLAMDWSDDDTVHQRGKISKAVVKEVRQLNFPRRRKKTNEVESLRTQERS